MHKKYNKTSVHYDGLFPEMTPGSIENSLVAVIFSTLHVSYCAPGNLSKHLQHPERCRQHPSNPSNPELIVLLQQEGEAAAHGETPGEPADGQGLDAASLQGEEVSQQQSAQEITKIIILIGVILWIQR